MQGIFCKLRYCIVFLFPFLALQAEDPQFSQFYANPLYLAPSFAGAVDGSRIAANYRSQWWDSPSSFVTYNFSYDHFFSTFNSGIGVFLLSDVAGSGRLGTNRISLNYSYDFKILNVWHLRPGLSFSYIEQGLGGTLKFIDEIVGGRDSDNSGSLGTSVHSPYSTARDIDAGVSALVYTRKVWFGVTVDHLLTPDISLYDSKTIVPLKTSVYGGYEFRRKGKLLKPSDETMTFAFLYKKHETLSQLDLGVYWHKFPLVLGLWYRGIPVVNSHRGDALIFLLGIKTRNFNIGYSYDFTISNLLRHTRGSHELSLSYKFLLPKRKKKGGVPCPEF